MANFINVIESGNRLEFNGLYSPIVCGNSNYVLSFKFSEVWQRCVKKTAVFVVEDKKQLVDFDGDECVVPTMPNAPFVLVSLFSGDGDRQYVTTPLKIRLEPTKNANDFSEFNQLSNYLIKVIGAINKIKNGDVIAKFAESSLTQVDREKDQVVKGRKNFIGSLQKHGQEVLNISEIANPNILLNGCFSVNQRKFSTTSVANTYTVDRWKNGKDSGRVDLNSDGTITLSGIDYGGGRFVQFLEEKDFFKLLGQKVTLSALVKTDETEGFKLVSVSACLPARVSSSLFCYETFVENQRGKKISKLRLHYDGLKFGTDMIVCNGQSITIKYMKLEIGEHPTAFHPRPHAEELILCQRFYQKLRIDCVCFCNNKNIIYPSINLPVTLRVKPTITNEEPCVKGGLMIQKGTNLVCVGLFDNALQTAIKTSDLTMEEGMFYAVTSEEFLVDAEIY